jgi:ketol-acid reductoisomerase
MSLFTKRHLSRILLLKDFMAKLSVDVIGESFAEGDNGVDNRELIEVNDAVRYHAIEVVGDELRAAMTAMKPLA